jgi:hypothetical protein
MLQINCTTVSLPIPSWLHQAVVKGIFATCRTPWGELVQVQIEDVREVRDVGPETWKVADVRVSPECLPFSVRVEQLYNLSAFIVQEVEA